MRRGEGRKVIGVILTHLNQGPTHQNSTTVYSRARYGPGVRGDLAGPHASIRPGISPSVLRTRTADRVSEYPIRKRSSRDRNYLPNRDGDFPSPPGLELDCPLRNPCRATHSSSGVERLPWE